MGFVFLLAAVCFICFLLVIGHLFTYTTDKSNLSRKQRVWIIVNLLVWAYECFFLVVVCGGVENLRVNFGAGMGDLLITFMLGCTVLMHIVLLTIFTYKHLEAVFLIILACATTLPLALMHLDAARGNDKNGYMPGSYSTGLYYNIETKNKSREHQQEFEKAKSDSITEFESFLRSAEQGHSWAQAQVAKCYAFGEGVEQNDSLAIKWCRLAAEAGDVMGQLNLGACYYNGDCGVDVDYREAVKWFLKAAEQGNAKAQYLTGRCYVHGKGVEQNDEEAFKWLRLAARQEHKAAQELLRDNKQTW